MSEYLISWLNEEIGLSKKITNVPKDFSNGYLFGELLYKTKQIPSLKFFKNSSKINDILNNFSILQHSFNQMEIPFNDINKEKIIKKDIYASFFYLHKIKQTLDKKCIDLKQIKLKNSNTLSKLYNNIYFKNDNEKYIHNVDLNSKRTKMKNKNFSYNKSTTFNKDYKSNRLTKEIKKDFPNLELNNFETKIIVDNIEDNINKYKLLKSNIYNLEQNRKKFNLKTETNNFNNWEKSLYEINNYKNNQIIEKYKTLSYYKNSVNKEFKFINKNFQHLSNDFDSKLQFLQKSQFDGINNKDALQKSIINKMIEKLNEKMKNKKLKEKNERKRLKEEQQMLNLNVLNNNNNKNKSVPKKFEKLITDFNVDNKREELKINNEGDNNINNIKTEMGETVTSSMTKLGYNDFGTRLLKNTKSLHWNNIKIGNRIDFFKTIMHEDENKNKKILPQININENDKKIFKKHKTQNSIFNKAAFYEQINKEDYLVHKKYSLIRLNKRNKNKEIIKDIIEQILDLTNYVSEIQTKNAMNLLEDEKWKELMKMFLNEEKFHKEKKILKHFLDIQKQDEKRKNKDALIKDKKSEEELYDYINYIGFFNDLIIPDNNIEKNKDKNKIRINKEYSFIEIYSDFYDPQKNGGVDIREYEPKQDEIDNLIFPQYPDYESNKKLNNIIQHIIENEIDNKENENENNLNKKIYNNLMSMIVEDKENILEKGKYFYLPIKLCFIGYPMSGKKLQSQLIHEKFPGVHIYNPSQMLKDKINEYNSIISPIENLPNYKKLKNNQIEELKKQKEEQLKEFEPILNIIKPILNNEGNESNKGQNENNNINEEIRSDIYMKLLLNELNKDFPEDNEKKIQILNELKDKYIEYDNINKSINDINEKIREEEDKMEENKNDKKPKKNNNLTNYHKELSKLSNDLELVKSSLFKGFIIINFPSNEKEAKFMENYFTGYISEYDKEMPQIEIEMKKYDYIIDYNLKKEKTKENQFSFLDYVINLNINSNEVERRYNGIEYDPTTNKLYHIEDNPPPSNDKKIMQRLIKGLPDRTKDDIDNEKEKYEIEFHGLFKFYKNMYNGINDVYLSIDNMDKNITNINENVILALEKIMFNYYYPNIEFIIEKINKQINQNQEKGNEKTKEEKNEVGDSSIKITNELEISNSIIKESTDSMIKDLSKNKALINHLYNIFTTFAEKYKTYIKKFIQFILEQKKEIFNYLNKKQNLFIEYLNRKTNNTDIADLYVKKYNSIFVKHPSLRTNDIVFNELMDDITDVKNSLWVYIQTKKKENVQFLQDIKNENKLQKEDENFWLFLINIIEIEVNKYLIFIEIIIKYYLSKIGIIYENIEDNNINNFFSFEFQKILFNGLEINNDEDSYEIKNKISKKNENTLEQNFEIIIKNTIKILIKEDEIIKSFQEKINNLIKKEHNKIISNDQNILSQTKKIKSTFKKKLVGISYSDISGFNEEIIEIINKEKYKLKYRILFLKYFSLRYQDIINNCFTETFTEMDEWIIYNVKRQNNTLNDFIEYLTRSLKRNKDNITLSNSGFDENKILDKYKIDLTNVYNKIYIKEILNIYNIYKDQRLIQLENLSYTQLFSYNLTDLLYIYNSLKEYGSYPYTYIIKYNIVYEIFIKKYLIQKGYYLLLNDNKKINEKNDISLNINKKFNKKTNKENNGYKLKSSIFINKIDIGNSKVSNKNNKTNNSASKANNMSTSRVSEIYISENLIKGIPKKLLNLTNTKYQKFLLIFETFNNKYININELFTTLLIIGSELITSSQFWDSIKNYLPENKLKENSILLTQEEFMNIKFWFEDDEYLNIPSDDKELEIYKNFEENNDNSIDDDEKIYKIKKIKESIFEINSEDNLFDIQIFKNLLDKLNKNINENLKMKTNEYSSLSNSQINLSVDKTNKSIEKTFTKTISDSAKQVENEHKREDKNKNVKKKLINEVENNIFDSIFF